MAGSTGLEPATSGLTVQCANQAAPRARIRNQRLRPREFTTIASLCPELCPCPAGVKPSITRPSAVCVRSSAAHVVVGDDAVALEDADRLVPGHTHRHALVNAGRHKVADRGAPKIVEDQRRLHDGLALAIDHWTPVAAHLRFRERSRETNPCRALCSAKSFTRGTEAADRRSCSRAIVKGAPEGGELSVDGGLRLSCGATLVRVALDTGGLHVVRFVLPEGFAERGQAEGQCRARAPPVRRVVGHQGIEELRHRHAAFRHRIPTTIARGFVDSTAQELDRIGVALALARLAPTLAVLASLDPPDPTAAVDRAEALEMLAMRRRGWRDLREELRDHRGRRHRGLFVLATSVHVGPPCAPSDTLPRPARAARRHPFGPRPQQSSAAPAAPPEERSWSASAPARPCLETWASAVLAIEDLRVAPHVLR